MRLPILLWIGAVLNVQHMNVQHTLPILLWIGAVLNVQHTDQNEKTLFKSLFVAYLEPIFGLFRADLTVEK